uniref:HupE/UreJ family protein n=1 Tax=Salibaculum sp. TaxID=2855480 RepID=UPI002870A748|nr:HupE/UreJ family protein [Salibaculum sp.]
MRMIVSGWDAVKLTLLALVSTMLVIAAGPSPAHEVRPTIGDMEVIDDRLAFTLEGNLESFIAGIDLEGLEDTDAAETSGGYDSLRALPPDQLAERMRAFWPSFTEEMRVLVDGAAVALRLDDVSVPEVGNQDLPRDATLAFSAALPEGAQAVQIDWPAHYGVLVLRQMGVDEGWDGYLSGGLSEQVALEGGQEMSGWQAFARYIPVGVEHIVPLGLDHILFVLGLFFLSTRLRPLIWQVTAFTAAHTITLALAALGYVTVSPAVVEPIIAASIVYVAVENVFSRGLNPWRPVVIFGFGLLHGLGFASVLGDYGIPETSFIPALLGFNIGVELGQLLVIALAFGLVFAAIRLSEDGKRNPVAAAVYLLVAVVVIPLLVIPVSAMGATAVEAYLPLMFMVAAIAGLSAASCAVERYETYRHMVAMPASIGIALIGAYWVVERVFL